MPPSLSPGQEAAPDRRRSGDETSARQSVSVIIPTYNVADIIPRCLDALSWADEIIIVDMFSTDDTVEVCKKYTNARVYQRKDYIFANVNFGLDTATTDWVIRLDSDEVINPELQASIQNVLRNSDPAINGYYFPSVQYIFGEPMRHGAGLPSMNQRKCLFRRGTARYECKAEHEDITATGPFGVLDGYYEHFTNHTVSEFVRKMNYYTDKDIERLGESELEPVKALKVWYRAIRMFILFYFQWQGYKDGYLGFYSSIMRGPIYVFTTEAKRWEAWKNRTPKASQSDRS